MQAPATHPRVGAGMRDRRGSLFDRDAAARAYGKLDVVPKVQVFATDIDEPRSRWRAPAAIPPDAGERRAATAAALLPRGRAELRAGQGSARPVHLLRAQRGPRSAILAHGHGLVPQSTDLFQRRAAGQRAARFPLRAQARRLSVPRRRQRTSRGTSICSPPSTRSIGSFSAARRVTTAVRIPTWVPGGGSAEIKTAHAEQTARTASNACDGTSKRVSWSSSRRRTSWSTVTATSSITPRAPANTSSRRRARRAGNCSRWRAAGCGWSCVRRCARRSRQRHTDRPRARQVELDDRVQLVRLTVEPLRPGRPGAVVPDRLHGPGPAADSRGGRATAAARSATATSPAWSTSCAKRAIGCRRPSRNTKPRSRS